MNYFCEAQDCSEAGQRFEQKMYILQRKMVQKCVLSVKNGKEELKLPKNFHTYYLIVPGSNQGISACLPVCLSLPVSTSVFLGNVSTKNFQVKFQDFSRFSRHKIAHFPHLLRHFFYFRILS